MFKLVFKMKTSSKASTIFISILYNSLYKCQMYLKGSLISPSFYIVILYDIYTYVNM